jgi:aryl-alcohol dehydrogenase-like predicted oxidoreductase
LRRSAERQEMISRIRSAVAPGVTFFDTAQVYGSFANYGLQMAACLNEAQPLEAFRAQIISEREIV